MEGLSSGQEEQRNINYITESDLKTMIKKGTHKADEGKKDTLTTATGKRI